MCGSWQREQCFEFGPGFFNRVEVWRVEWQVEQIGPAELDSLAHAVDLVALRLSMTTTSPTATPAQDLFQIGKKDLPIRGCLNDHGGNHAAGAHGAQDGQHRNPQHKPGQRIARPTVPGI